jgi:hypothetical protein
VSRQAATADASANEVRISANDVEPGRLLAGATPGHLPHRERLPPPVGELARARHAAVAPEQAVSGMLEDATPPAHLLDRARSTRWVLVPAEEPEPTPRPTRGMGDDRMRTLVQLGVPDLVPPLLDELRIGPVGHHVKGRNVVPFRSRDCASFVLPVTGWLL